MAKLLGVRGPNAVVDSKATLENAEKVAAVIRARRWDLLDHQLLGETLEDLAKLSDERSPRHSPPAREALTALGKALMGQKGRLKGENRPAFESAQLQAEHWELVHRCYVAGGLDPSTPGARSDRELRKAVRLLADELRKNLPEFPDGSVRYGDGPDGQPGEEFVAVQLLKEYALHPFKSVIALRRHLKVTARTRPRLRKVSG